MRLTQSGPAAAVPARRVRVSRGRAERRDRAEARCTRQLGAAGEVRADLLPRARRCCGLGVDPVDRLTGAEHEPRVGSELERRDPVLARARDRHADPVVRATGEESTAAAVLGAAIELAVVRRIDPVISRRRRRSRSSRRDGVGGRPGPQRAVVLGTALTRVCPGRRRPSRRTASG